MSQPRSEFLSPEQRSSSPESDTNHLTLNTTSSSRPLVTLEKNSEENKNFGTSSPSSSFGSSSCEDTVSSGSDISSDLTTGESSSSGSNTNVVDDSDHISLDSSTSSLQPSFRDHHPAVNATETLSSTAVVSGNGPLSSSSDVDISQGSSIVSESDPETNNFHQSCDRFIEAVGSEDFETVFSVSEEESDFTGLESLDDSLASNVEFTTRPAEEKSGRSRQTTTYPQSYYPRGPEHRNTSTFGRNPGGIQERIFRNKYLETLRRLDNFLHRMSVRVARYHKELCIVFLVFASGFASLRTSPAKLRATSVPTPFFEDKDAAFFLQDNYMGEYVDLANKQIPYHPSFLFYYAPWDSESVASKSVFLSVAKHFYFSHHGRVKFYAINCWWPGGQCRKNYKNLSHYPIFVAHIGRTTGIIYNGPIRLQPMVKFINSLLKPVTRIDTEDELWSFRARHDVIMLGYFNFTLPDSAEAYETYLQMALRTFEADPFNQVGFGLFLRPELAEKFFLTTSNAISLVLFNEIHTAKWHGGYHPQGLKGPVSQVAEWIIERTKTVPITWVYALRNGFANRPAALGPQDFAQQLLQGPVFLLISRRYFPSGHSPFYMQVKEIALDYFNCNRSGNVTKLRRTSHKVNSEWAGIWTSVVQICQRKGSFQCQQMMSNIDHWNQKRYLFKREPLLRYENVSSALNFTGLSCASDRQFKFLAVDPVDVPYFIKLGLNGLKNSEESEYSVDPMAFIIDSQYDVILPLPSLNITEMATIIHNYTVATENGDVNSFTNQLYLNTDGIDGLHSEVIRDQEMITKNNMLTNWGSYDILQYMRGNGNPVNDSVLVLYTASFCGYCALAVTHFVALSRFLEENYGNDSLKVKLVKIDMFKNSLPPNLNPEELPTVAFIPNWNRTDIRMYPLDQEISTLNLLKFLLSELDPNVRVQASLMSPSCNNNHCITINQSSESRIDHCNSASSLSKSNSTDPERLSCIKSSKNSVSSQIELLLQKLQSGEEALFDSAGNYINQMTPQAWNGQLLDRLRTMSVTLDVS